VSGADHGLQGQTTSEGPADIENAIRYWIFANDRYESVNRSLLASDHRDADMAAQLREHACARFCAIGLEVDDARRLRRRAVLEGRRADNRLGLPVCRSGQYPRQLCVRCVPLASKFVSLMDMRSANVSPELKRMFVRHRAEGRQHGR
jgi:hypothetical protein